MARTIIDSEEKINSFIDSFQARRYVDYLFFFFFQAEDGIRDLTVTGVQTCALPICRDGAHARVEPDDLPVRAPDLRPARTSTSQPRTRAGAPRGTIQLTHLGAAGDRKSVV